MNPLDWTHPTTEIREAGRHFERQAGAAELAMMASELGLLECSGLAARYEVRPLPGARFRVAGRVIAELVQSCVVTLEPVPQSLDEQLDVTFCPAGDIPAPSAQEREILSEPDIEPYSDGRIEVGRVIFELLASAIDPYPRRQGATFDWDDAAAGSRATEPSPFAVLAKLRKEK